MRISNRLFSVCAIAALAGCNFDQLVPASSEGADLSSDALSTSDEVAMKPLTWNKSEGVSACSGDFAYIPSNRGSEVPFSIQIQETAVRIVWLDYSPTMFSEKHIQPDGTIVFYADGAGPTVLKCQGNKAFVKFADNLQISKENFRLTRVHGDIFDVAREKGWEVGD